MPNYDSTRILLPFPSTLLPRGNDTFAITTRAANDPSKQAPCPSCNLIEIPYNANLPRLMGVM